MIHVLSLIVYEQLTSASYMLKSGAVITILLFFWQDWPGSGIFPRGSAEPWPRCIAAASSHVCSQCVKEGNAKQETKGQNLDGLGKVSEDERNLASDM